VLREIEGAPGVVLHTIVDKELRAALEQGCRDVEMTFSRALRAMLRQAPNVIMIGEIRDLETAEISINASLTTTVRRGTMKIMLEAQATEIAKIANVSGITRDPNSEIVKVNYNRLVSETLQGSLDDPRIRQLLLLGAQNNGNAGVRDDSVGLLANECRNGHQCDDGPIRNALMVALRYDKNPNVRLKALEGLQPYIAEDMRVRDAVLESLMKDSDPRVRTQAISLIEPVEGDSSVREVLHTVAMQDESPQIRTASRQVLQQLPEIQ